MNDVADIQALLHSIACKITQVFQKGYAQSACSDAWIQPHWSLLNEMERLLPLLFEHPEKIQQTQHAYYQDIMQLVTQVSHSEKWASVLDWESHPIFEFFDKHHALVTHHMHTLIESLDWPNPTSKKRMVFVIKQYLDALSPQHFFATNPEVMKTTMETQGKNMLSGLYHFLSDLEAGRMRMTDLDAFQLGENIAITPGEVIHQNEMMELIQYHSQTSQVKSTPLLIIPPWINKYYILDLSARNSMVRWLVEQGITVFMISWVNPNERYASKGLEDYLLQGPIEAVSVIQAQLGVSSVNALGFCLGGTLLSLLLAYYHAQDNPVIHSATFLATLMDFSQPGDIGVFIDEDHLNQLDVYMQNKGYLDGRWMALAFNALRANDLIWSFFIRHYLHGQSPVAFDFLYWNADTTNMPARMHSEYLRWMYLDNVLTIPNQIKLNGVSINVHAIKIPTCFIATQKDHIAPWQAVYQGYRWMKGKKRFMLGGSGHIAGIIIPPGGEKYGYYTNAKSPVQAEKWLEHAEYHQGSWWPEWLNWLDQYLGSWDDPPVIKRSIRPAPGEYVFCSGS